jgi:type IV pilus assembly protein PilV
MPGRQGGALMIEVLVAIAIVIFGVLAVMRVQGRLQLSEVEAYQRTQALILLDDMVSRIETNRNDAENYVTASPLGTGADCTEPGTPTLQETDSSQWCSALQGAAETQGGSNVGAMIGGRGCVEEVVGPGVREYLITVVWQGMTPIAAPPASITCAANAFDEVGTSCVNDLCRRYVSTIIRQADLETI